MGTRRTIGSRLEALAAENERLRAQIHSAQHATPAAPAAPAASWHSAAPPPLGAAVKVVSKAVTAPLTTIAERGTFGEGARATAGWWTAKVLADGLTTIKRSFLSDSRLQAIDRERAKMK